eukprot:27048-Eustigmatos_ZCMA.PRE.1
MAAGALMKSTVEPELILSCIKFIQCLWTGLSRFTPSACVADAVFIPEGWWHQVDSSRGTIAVNYVSPIISMPFMLQRGFMPQRAG